VNTELAEKLAGREVVASISGGKDSAAMALHFMELGIPFRSVFADTTWEHPKTYEYLTGPLTKKIGPIDIVRGDQSFEELIRSKGMFPARLTRFCTEYLKVVPLQRYFKALPDDHDYVSAVGIRSEESKSRAEMPEWEWSTAFDCEIWRPIKNWTEQDVIDIHRRHDLEPNPLYLLGSRRVGCWPCIFAPKREVKLVAETDPDRIDRIRQLEADIYEIRTKRFAARGEVQKYPSTFFTLRPDNVKHVTTPIDEVVEWARKGQLDIFGDEDARDGCMRWGLCGT
jgi:3'-phosphoadenosine 5'-phosphosulfate sulfotransferase (PAPS reductase)/FAD synthetase